MLIWLNGPFGAGKTTIAQRLVAADSRLRSFDPETVGSLLLANLRDRPIADFQDLRAWRELVPRVAGEIARLTSMDLVAVQTVTVEAYWAELQAGLAAQDLEPVHVLLDCDEGTLRERILSDAVDLGAREWRLDHVAGFVAARPWLVAAADLVVDTTAAEPDEIARQIIGRIPVTSSQHWGRS
jgi:adenylylsulfate kinase-like enzyme